MDPDNELPLSSLGLLETIYNDRLNATHYNDPYEMYFAVCQVVANSLGFKITKPVTDLSDNPSALQYLETLAGSNRLRLRKIRLKKNWWNHDLGSLIVVYKKHLCALIYQSNGLYELIDLVEGKRFTLKNSRPDEIQSNAYVFYPTLPNKKLSVSEVINFSFSTLKGKILKIVFYQLIASLFFMLTPIITGIIFENIIPYSNLTLLGNYTILLLVSYLVILLIYLLQARTILQLQMKAKHKIQVGIWDRLLRLPLSFFKQYSTGDLSYRSNIVNEIQHILSTNTLMTLMAGIMSLINLGLMLYINVYLALAAILLVIIIGIVSFLFNLLILRQQRIVVNQNSSINSVLLSLINEIVKIRISHKEAAAFKVWNNEFSEKIRSQNRVNRYSNSLNVFNLGFMGFSLLMLYVLVIWLGNAISFGEFIVFNAAFIQLFTSIISLASTLGESIEIAPLLNKAMPIFETMPEEKITQSLTPLDGHIVIEDIVFRYPGSEKPVFVDFNLEIKPGSFTAIVGPSGSGKSSLFRLLLALENFESGEIKFSGINIQNLQPHDLRRQIGVVMQSTQVIPGSIFENIAGRNTALSRENAWEIARKVGLELLIQDLPMGMDTLLNDGIQTLSTGEIQRINLARAISSNPKILMLDEATSALDNRVQNQIHQVLQAMNTTRIVIAHRLATIQFADIIHVIEGGQCVESGTYAELIEAGGLFTRLASK